MKTLLMHEDRDFDMQQALPGNEASLAQDLELNVLLRSMAQEDPFLFEVARKAIFTALQNDIDTVLYRQDILKDCLKNPSLLRELYSLAVQAIEEKKHRYITVFRNYPAGTLYDAINALQFFTEILWKLKGFADMQSDQFHSKGFTTLFAILRKEFNDEYFARIQNHLLDLKFKSGVLVSARLGNGNEGYNYVLRQSQVKEPNWFQRLLGKGPPGYTFRLADRDEAGARILSGMRDRGINLIANALAQSTEHILSFFQTLRTELGFYIGCLNLHDSLAAKSVPTTFPQPAPTGIRHYHFRSLHDVSLALTMEQKVVGNDLDADGKALVIITGANQGGKSSFLRSIGLAQLMMQSGMFAAAESFTAEFSPGLFTHYKRQEDLTMNSGKLDEELVRMSRIVDAITPNSMMLFNESFASTNEREGSEIASQIVSALVERGIRVFFVTHLYEFAHGMFEQKNPESIFLRAERRPDGTRSFQLVTGEPLETSYGQDLYEKVFAVAAKG